MSDLLTSGTGLATATGAAAAPSWQTRLKPEIKLTDSQGQVHTAAWRGDDVVATRRIAEYDAPLVEGTQIQDLAPRGRRWPLTLYFHGPAHDVDAMRFLDAFTTVAGSWDVLHPVYGLLKLQPITVTLKVSPVDEGGITVAETDWIEPARGAAQLAVPVVASQIAALAGVADADALASFAELAQSADPAALASLASAGTQALGVLRASPLSTLAQTVGSVRSAFDQAYTQTLAFLTAPVLDLIAIGQGVQQIMALPATIQADLTAKLSSYATMLVAVGASFFPAAGEEARTATVMTELVLTAGVTNMARCTAVGIPRTREQALAAMDTVAAALADVTTMLDAAQTAQDGEHFSLRATYTTLSQLVALVQALMLRLMFDLRVAKRFPLDRPRTPLEITLTEYGTLGDGDEMLDLFLLSNGLIGQDVLLLPAGREVVVYLEPRRG